MAQTTSAARAHHGGAKGLFYTFVHYLSSLAKARLLAMSMNSIPLTPLVAMSFASQMMALGVAIAIPLFVIAWVLRHKVKQAEEDLKLLIPEPPETEELASVGKRAGQFGIFDLLVLMTFAAVACGIVRLPIHFTLKMLAITAVWFGFYFWALGKPSARKCRSLAFKRRAAILHAVGSILVITPFLWYLYEQSSRLPAVASAGFMLPMLISPFLAIWKAGRAVRAELAAGRRKKAVAN
jgi:hypothetical protein